MATTNFVDKKTVISTEWLNDTDAIVYGLEGDPIGIVYKGRQLLKNYSETVVTNSTATGAVSINVQNGNIYNLTLTGNVVFTFTNPAAATESTTIVLRITQDGTGSRTITWPASVRWPSGTAPTLTTTAGAYSKLVFDTIDGGTTWDGQLSGDNYS